MKLTVKDSNALKHPGVFFYSHRKIENCFDLEDFFCHFDHFSWQSSSFALFSLHGKGGFPWVTPHDYPDGSTP